MTSYDKSTFTDALKILKKFSLQHTLPNSTLSVLKSGVNGNIPETPKKTVIKNTIILNNLTCLLKMKDKSKKLGYKAQLISNITGNLDQVTQMIASKAITSKNNCIIFGLSLIHI